MNDEKRKGSGLGIVGYDGYEFVVADLERSRSFYTEMMDMAERRGSTSEWPHQRGEDAVLFHAGKAQCVCVTPRERGSRGRSLAQTPPRRGRRSASGCETSSSDQRGSRANVMRPSAPISSRRPTTKGAPTGSSTSPPHSATCASDSSSAPPRRCRRVSSRESERATAEPVRFPGHRPHHLQLPDARTPHHLAPRRDGLRGVLAGSLPHRRRQPGAAADRGSRRSSCGTRSRESSWPTTSR